MTWFEPMKGLYADSQEDRRWWNYLVSVVVWTAALLFSWLTSKPQPGYPLAPEQPDPFATFAGFAVAAFLLGFLRARRIGLGAMAYAFPWFAVVLSFLTFKATPVPFRLAWCAVVIVCPIVGYLLGRLILCRRTTATSRPEAG